MNKLNLFKLFSAVIVSSMMIMITSVKADGHGGMNVPKIGSMVIMSGLENPWDIAFTNDGKNMFYTEKTKGLSVKTPTGVNALLGMKGTSGYADTANDLFFLGCSRGNVRRCIGSKF
jgi:hypothetical protein